MVLRSSVFRSSIDLGSPACSPQIPISIFLLVFFAFVIAIFMSSRTPSLSSRLKGSSRYICFLK